MLDGIVAFLFMAIVMFAVFYAYKKRVSIAHWLNDPDMVADKGLRSMRLKHHIEECNYRLKWLEENKTEE